MKAFLAAAICGLGTLIFAAGGSFGEFAPPSGGSPSPATAAHGDTRPPAASPYGVCAHLHWVKSPAERADESRRIAAAGIGRVRFDFLWRDIQKEPDGPFDFSHYDEVMADAEGAGLTPS